MKLIVISIALLAVCAPATRAQMVVDRNRGEQVDRPFAPRLYVPHRRRRHRQTRILAVQSAFPPVQPFGAVECCL